MTQYHGLPQWLSGKESTCQCRGSIPGSGRSHGVRNGNPLQYPCLQNSIGRGNWRAAVYGVTKDWTQLSNWAWRRKWQPAPVFLPGESCGQRSLVGSCPWGRTVGHNWSDLACMHTLEKDMATHSSILAWRISETEEPGGLLSMGSHRVRHDWSNLAAAAASNWAHTHVIFA